MQYGYDVEDAFDNGDHPELGDFHGPINRRGMPISRFEAINRYSEEREGYADEESCP